MGKNWRDIKGYEGYYQVSNLGAARSVTRKVWRSDSKWGHGYLTQLSGRRLSCVQKDNGYFVVTLSLHGKHRTHYIHRLIADAFLENPNSLPEVNHKDGNKSNNHIGNLEWCSHKENAVHAWENGLAATPPPQKKKPVAKITGDGNVVETYPSIQEAAQEHGGKCYESRISECCLGKRKKFRGHSWQHIEEAI